MSQVPNCFFESGFSTRPLLISGGGTSLGCMVSNKQATVKSKKTVLQGGVHARGVTLAHRGPRWIPLTALDDPM